MTNTEPKSRTDRIIERLRTSFEVVSMSLHDESHKHVGHAGAADGRGHFALTICAPEFDNLTPLKRHRLVYKALGDLLESDIHAIRIQARGSLE